MFYRGACPLARCALSRSTWSPLVVRTVLLGVLRQDSTFRIYSMIKPITSVALMMLFEESRFLLSDLISLFGGALKKRNMRVWQSGLQNSVDGMYLDVKREVVNTLQLRRTRAVVYRTWMVGVDSQCYKVMEQAKADYVKATEGKAGHGHGLLDYHLLAALARVAVESGTLGDPEMQAVRKFREQHAEPKTDRNQIKHCKLGAALVPEVRRLEVHAVEVFKVGFDEKEGVMPPDILVHLLFGMMEGRRGRKGQAGLLFCRGEFGRLGRHPVTWRR